MATIKIQRLSLILISKRMYRVGFVCSMQWLLHFLKITELRPRPKGYCVNPKIVGGGRQQLFSECIRLESNAGINQITAPSVF
ncbi:BnaC02g13650D [Brassica napus]|uniref:(rape) hypothetical protein n=1 Tax=Brassica napus TaxID=3708 RepID=A0A078HVN4_BRANA|nr:unnamed protein product [Brassica napus]CDY41791.1 BnaC02g13650D [Brassica napus]